MTLNKLNTLFSKFKNSRLDYFFSGKNHLDLGFGRIIFFSYLLERYLSDWHHSRFLKFHDVPQLFWQPLSIFKLMPLEHIYIFNNDIFYTILLFSYAMSAIGLLSKIFIPLSFIMSYIIIGFPNNFGTVFDSTCMITVILGLLCFANAGRSISIDSLIRKKKASSLPEVWFLNFIPFLIMFFYFCSAIQKIRFAGLDFYTPDHMSIAMIYNDAPLGRYLAQFKWVGTLASVSIVLIQLATIITLFFKKYILPFSLIYLFFHLSVDLTMGRHFNLMKICYVFVFPWSSFFNDISSLFLNKKLIKEDKISFDKKSRVIKSYIIISAITFSLASYAVITNVSLWPFSTTTMYAFLDELPYKQKEIYLIGDKEHLVTNDDLKPIGTTKVRLTIEKLMKAGHSIEEIAKETKKFINTNTDFKYNHLEIRVCTYNTISELRQYYPNLKGCEVMTRLSF